MERDFKHTEDIILDFKRVAWEDWTNPHSDEVEADAPQSPD